MWKSIFQIVFLCIVCLVFSSPNLYAGSILVSQGFSTGYNDTSWSNMTSALNVSTDNHVNVTQNFENLSQMLSYDALWLDLRERNVNGPCGTLSNTEVININRFIDTGRRVVMIGEWGNLYNEPHYVESWDNQILGIVGGSFGGTPSENLTGIMTPVTTNQLTTGINQINLQGNSLGVAVGGTSLFNYNFATLWGNNNVLTVLDEGIFNNYFWNSGDNSLFAQNVAHWIADSDSYPHDYTTSITSHNDFAYSLTLGDSFSFDYWWEMGQEVNGFNMDIFYFKDNSWHLLGGDVNFDGSSSGWESMSMVVPEELRGVATQIRFGVLDLGDDTDPTVYLRNISSNGTAPVPEPATLLLLATGLMGLAGFRKIRG